MKNEEGSRRKKKEEGRKKNKEEEKRRRELLVGGCELGYKKTDREFWVGSAVLYDVYV